MLTTARPLGSDIELICRVLRGEAPGAPPGLDSPDAAAAFFDTTYYHGVQELLDARLGAETRDATWPADVLAYLARRRRFEAAAEIVRGRELARVLEAFEDRGIHPLLFKGAALASTHYPSPELRSRGDSDLLVGVEDRERAVQVLTDLGYARGLATSGALVSYEAMFTREDRYGRSHVVDLHWRVSNRQIFAESLSYDELARGAWPAPRVSPPARVLCPVHALAVACMHRAKHLTSPVFVNGQPRVGDRLIWLYDIHLLLEGMSTAELTEFHRFAVEQRIAGICLDGLKQAERWFHTALPSEVVRVLSEVPTEPSISFLTPGRLRTMLRDIRSLSSGRDRLRLVKEHLLPPAEYMLRKYAVSSRAWLPALYVHRGTLGLWRLLRER